MGMVHYIVCALPMAIMLQLLHADDDDDDDDDDGDEDEDDDDDERFLDNEELITDDKRGNSDDGDVTMIMGSPLQGPLCYSRNPQQHTFSTNIYIFCICICTCVLCYCQEFTLPQLHLTRSIPRYSKKSSKSSLSC